MLVHFPFNLLSPGNGLFKFLSHSVFDFVFPFNLLFWDFYDCIKVNLNALNELKILLNMLIGFLDDIFVNLIVFDVIFL